MDVWHRGCPPCLLCWILVSSLTTIFDGGVVSASAPPLASKALSSKIDDKKKRAWRWSKLAVSGLSPSSRQGHAAVEVGSRIYVFGGCTQDVQCFNDVHVFDTDTRTWTKEPFSGDAPEPRGGHSATLHGTSVFIYAGASGSGTLGDVYRFDLMKRRWTRGCPSMRNADDNRHAVPRGRTSHAAAADAEGRIYIFGGYSDDGTFLSDLWVLTVEGVGDEAGTCFPISWSMPGATGPMPAARSSHSMTLVDQNLVVFGGYTSDGHVTNDVHLFDLEEERWSSPVTAGAVPAPRQAHSAARDGHDVVIAGGCDISSVHSACYNDVWSLSVVDMRWTQRSSGVDAWFQREGHTATFVGGSMYLFGGCDLGLRCYEDVTVLGLSPNELQKQQKQQQHEQLERHQAQQSLAQGSSLVAANSSASGKLQRSAKAEAVAQRQQQAGKQATVPRPTIGHQGPEHVPTNRDFGVDEVNPIGHTGVVIIDECRDNCNFRGICQESTCYCQPGFTGQACESERQSTKGTHSIGVSLAVSGTCFVVTLLSVLGYGLWKWKQKIQSDRDNGYVV